MQKIRTVLLVLALLVEGTTLMAQGVQASLRRGRELFELGRWSDARKELREVQQTLTEEQHEEQMEVKFLLAACAVELGSPYAEGALLTFEQRYPASIYTNDVRFSLASYYCTCDKLAKAQEYFEKTNYKALSPSRKEQYNIRLGYLRFQQGDYRGAYDLFDRINPRSTYADHALYYKSYIDYAEGKYGLARQGFEQLVGREPYGALAPFYLLQIEFREGNYDYVIEQGKALLAKAAPERKQELLRVMAESYFRRNDYTDTIAHLSDYISSGGELEREGCYLMGFSLYRTTRYEEAVGWLRKACGAEDALTQNASYHLADSYLHLGDKQGAMQAFAMASDEALNPTIAEDALFNYAKLQYELGGGAFNGAINLLTRYLERYPSSERAAEARTLLIAAYYNSSDYDAAYRAIKALPSRDSEIRAALQKITYFRGLEAFKAGNYTEAQRYLEESATEPISPKYVALNTFWQGEIAFLQGDYALAAAKYRAYLTRAPRTERTYAMAHYNLGYCAFLRKDMAGAGADFSKFLSLYSSRDGYRADAYNRLGDVHYSERQFSKAIGDYDLAIALRTPERHYSRYQRAITLGILGRVEPKQQALRQIIDEGEGDYVDDASYELGRSYIASSRYADGAKQLERFVQEYPSSPHRIKALSDLGLAFFNLGNKEKSRHYYEQVVTSSPHSSEAKAAMQGIREIYLSEGEAERYFDYAAKVGAESDLSQLSRDSLSFAAAQKLYLEGELKVAEKSLRSYVKSYPKGYYRVDALYFLSDCYLRSGAREEAIATLSELAAEGVTQHSVPVLEKLSAMTYEDKRYGEAAQAYRQLYEVASTASEREQAMTGYVRATLATGDKTQVEKMATDVLAHPDAGKFALREARYALATQLREGGERAEALNHYRELANDLTTKQGSEAAYWLVEERFQQGDMEATEKAVFALAEREPHAYWLAKAFLLLGDVYVKKGDTFQARATYQSVADGYSPADDGIVEEAKARITKLTNNETVTQ